MPRLVYTRQDFDAEHGECLTTEEGRILYEDGAMILSGGRQPVDPPADEEQNLRARILFAKLKYTRARDAMRTLQTNRTWHPRSLGPEPDGDEYRDPQYGFPLVAKLTEAAHSIVQALKQTLTDLENELAALPQVAARTHANERNRQAQEELKLRQDHDLQTARAIDIP